MADFSWLCEITGGYNNITSVELPDFAVEKPTTLMPDVGNLFSSQVTRAAGLASFASRV